MKKLLNTYRELCLILHGNIQLEVGVVGEVNPNDRSDMRFSATVKCGGNPTECLGDHGTRGSDFWLGTPEGAMLVAIADAQKTIESRIAEKQAAATAELERLKKVVEAV